MVGPVYRLSPFAPARPDRSPPDGPAVPMRPRKPRPRRKGDPHGPETLDRIRAYVEKTTLSYREIAARTGTSAATVSRRAKAGGWARPGAEPLEHFTEEGRRRLRRHALAERLMRQTERCVERLEQAPAPEPAEIRRALRLARAAASFDRVDRPRRKPRRRRLKAKVHPHRP
ncbi:helix-turn-helix domain-containing protein [Microvirga pudoricolor]|uniref:helix-turn-helix domain-containing protein n=1 Tax=Microvirga pudoricolor TaxID=2778729 RepID=UPI00194F7205|nr:helix-turn-helix domain-containing protein [Microvirga pudoricolor]